MLNVEDAAVPFIIAAVANFNREGHTPQEVADSIDQMRKLNIPMEEVARILGISAMWAYQMHGLKKLHPQVWAQLDPALPKERRLPVAAAIQISKVDPLLHAGLARKVLEKAISLNGLRDEALRLSRAAGTYVRERRQEPGKFWESANALSRRALIAKRDLKLLLEKDGAGAIVKGRSPAEIRELLDRLRSSRDLLAKLEAKILSLR